MADKPIPFSDPMVAALLAGRKTKTRRILDPQPVAGAHYAGVEPSGDWMFTKGCFYGRVRPRYAPGDRLYVRETYYQFGHWEPVAEAKTKGGKQKWAFVPDNPEIRFETQPECRLGRHHRDPYTSAWHKRLGRFMPRAASRLTLVVENVKVERLNEISEADALAEGVLADADYSGSFAAEYCQKCGGSGVHGAFGAGYGVTEVDCAECETPKLRFRNLWTSINGAGAWDANPWIVAIGFRVIRANIDSEEARNG